MATSTELLPAPRLRSAWIAAHAPVAGVSPRVRVAAYAIPLTTLPASIWRIAACTFHAPIVRGRGVADGPSGVPGLPLSVYVIVLSLVSELLAFSAVGLVARWGEVVPRWVPVLGGRAVPTRAAVIPAAAGALVLTGLWTWMGITQVLGRRLDLRPQTSDTPVGFDGWPGLLCLAAYAPLLLWGPLLGFVTASYWKRRRHAPVVAG
jgi:hypothetical protein